MLIDGLFILILSPWWGYDVQIFDNLTSNLDYIEICIIIYNLMIKKYSIT